MVYHMKKRVREFQAIDKSDTTSRVALRFITLYVGVATAFGRPPTVPPHALGAAVLQRDPPVPRGGSLPLDAVAVPYPFARAEVVASAAESMCQTLSMLVSRATSLAITSSLRRNNAMVPPDEYIGELSDASWNVNQHTQIVLRPRYLAHPPKRVTPSTNVQT